MTPIADYLIRPLRPLQVSPKVWLWFSKKPALMANLSRFSQSIFAAAIKIQSQELLEFVPMEQRHLHGTHIENMSCLQFALKHGCFPASRRLQLLQSILRHNATNKYFCLVLISWWIDRGVTQRAGKVVATALRFLTLCPSDCEELLNLLNVQNLRDLARFAITHQAKLIPSLAAHGFTFKREHLILALTTKCRSDAIEELFKLCLKVFRLHARAIILDRFLSFVEADDPAQFDPHRTLEK